MLDRTALERGRLGRRGGTASTALLVESGSAPIAV